MEGVVNDAAAALALLKRLEAPHRLIRHHELVVEAAHEIVKGLGRFGSHFDANEVLIGAALHDAGKILFLGEMDGPGDRHEAAGKELLRGEGLRELARFCVTHADWDRDDLALEDLLVALADKLWKGKRVADLEQRVVDRLVARSGSPFWDVFTLADDLFEAVAAGADRRLAASTG